MAVTRVTDLAEYLADRRRVYDEAFASPQGQRIAPNQPLGSILASGLPMVFPAGLAGKIVCKKCLILLS
jgi:hypothetical protein